MEAAENKALKKATDNYVGKNMCNIRLNKGWTQEYTASKLGISTGAYSKIENGLTNPNFSRLKKIAKVFGVALTDLFLLTDKNVQIEKKIAEFDSEIIFLSKKVIWLYEELRNNQIKASNKMKHKPGFEFIK